MLPVQAARFELVPALKAGAEAIRRHRRLIGRNVLIVGQIALAMVLLIMVGMGVDGFRHMLAMYPGFQKDHLISMDLNPSVLRYSPEQTHDFYRKLADRARVLPGIESIAMAEALPFSLSPTSVVVVPEGYLFPPGRDRIAVFGGAVDENYFSTMKVQIVQGRAFSRDDRMDGGSNASSRLMGLGTMSIANFVIVPATLLVVSVAACYLPARRAASLDPIRALRLE